MNTGKPGRFDDMDDDLPFEPSPRERELERNFRHDGGYGEPHAAELARIARNRSKNAGRKYKPQRGRMKLLMCVLCGWKCRTTASMIEAGIPGCPRPSCRDYQKPLEKMD